MKNYFDKEFYNSLRKDYERYTTDYDAIMERNERFEQLAQERLDREEKEYEILERFGVIQ